MDVDSAHLGESFARLRKLEHRRSELACAPAWLFTQELAVADRGPVARGQHELLLRELVIELVERVAVSFEYALETLVGPLSELGDFLGGRGPELVKMKLARVVADAR